MASSMVEVRKSEKVKGGFARGANLGKRVFWLRKQRYPFGLDLGMLSHYPCTHPVEEDIKAFVLRLMSVNARGIEDVPPDAMVDGC